LKILLVRANRYNNFVLKNNCNYGYLIQNNDIFFLNGDKEKRRIRNLRKLEEGSILQLEKNQVVRVSKNGFDVEDSHGRTIDLGTYKYRELISQLKEGEEQVFSERDFNKLAFFSGNKFKLFRKNGSIYLQNLSNNLLNIKAYSAFKIYNKDYLKETFTRKFSFNELFLKKYSQIRSANYSQKETFSSDIQSFYMK